jgi:hypothetical protein
MYLLRPSICVHEHSNSSATGKIGSEIPAGNSGLGHPVYVCDQSGEWFQAFYGAADGI